MDIMEMQNSDSLSGLVYSDDSIIVTYNNVCKRYGFRAGIIIKLKGY